MALSIDRSEFDGYGINRLAYFGPVTALSFLRSSPRLLLAGMGPFVRIYDSSSGTKLAPDTPLLRGSRIHGFYAVPRETPDFEGGTTALQDGSVNESVVGWGQKFVSVFCIKAVVAGEATPSGEVKIEVMAKCLEDWIFDVACIGWRSSVRQGLSGSDKRARLFIVGFAHNNVAIYNNDFSSCLLRSFSTDKSLLYSFSFLPASLDGDRDIVAASGTIYSNVLVWRPFLASREAFDGGDVKADAKLSGHEGVIFRVRWSKEGDELISVSDDRTVRIWSNKREQYGDGHLANWECVGIFVGHDARVWDCLVSNNYFISASEDCTCRIWERSDRGSSNRATAWREVSQLLAHTGKGVRSLAIEGTIAASGGDDGQVKLWNIEEEIERAAHTFGGKFEKKEKEGGDGNSDADSYTIVVPSMPSDAVEQAKKGELPRGGRAGRSQKKREKKKKREAEHGIGHETAAEKLDVSKEQLLESLEEEGAASSSGSSEFVRFIVLLDVHGNYRDHVAVIGTNWGYVFLFDPVTRDFKTLAHLPEKHFGPCSFARMGDKWILGSGDPDGTVVLFVGTNADFLAGKVQVTSLRVHQYRVFDLFFTSASPLVEHNQANLPEEKERPLYLYTTSPREPLRRWRVELTEESNGCLQACGEIPVAVAPRVTSVQEVEYDGRRIVIVGTHSGAVLVFALEDQHSSSLPGNGGVPVEHSNPLPLLFRQRRVHLRGACVAIEAIQGGIRSIGKDASLVTFAFHAPPIGDLREQEIGQDVEASNQLFSVAKREKYTRYTPTVDKIIRLLDTEYLSGFDDTDFMLWDVAKRSLVCIRDVHVFCADVTVLKVLRIEHAAGRRPRDFALFSDSDGRRRYCMVYYRAGLVHVIRGTLTSNTMKSETENFKSAFLSSEFHGKEANCVLFLKKPEVHAGIMRYDFPSIWRSLGVKCLESEWNVSLGFAIFPAAEPLCRCSLLTGGMDNKVKIVDYEGMLVEGSGNLNCVQTILGHENPIRCMALSSNPKQRLLLTGGVREMLKSWRIVDRCDRRDSAFSETAGLSGSSVGVDLWSALSSGQSRRPGVLQPSMTDVQQRIVALELQSIIDTHSDDSCKRTVSGLRVFACATDGFVRVFEIIQETRRSFEIGRVRLHKLAILSSASVQLRGQTFILTGATEGILKIWSAAHILDCISNGVDPEPLFEQLVHNGGLNCIDVTIEELQDEKHFLMRVVTGGDDQSLHVLMISAHQERSTALFVHVSEEKIPCAHSSAVKSVALVDIASKPGEFLVASSGYDQRVNLWIVKKQERKEILHFWKSIFCEVADVAGLALSPLDAKASGWVAVVVGIGIEILYIPDE